MAEQQRAVAALAAEVNAITAAAEQDFARPTRCHGWAVKDLLLHLLRDAYWALVVFATPTQAPATRWSAARRPLGRDCTAAGDPHLDVVVSPLPTGEAVLR